jgi:thiol-disulfide isomerase/thioredoxin
VYTQDVDVRGQLADAPSSRQEFRKEKVLRFEFIDITKTKYKSKELSGKVIVIDCWATWCKPCQKGLPELSEMKKKYHDKIVILGISFDKSLETVKNYLQDDDIGRGINYPIVFGPRLAKFWDDVSVLPTTFLIDKEGYLRCRYRGYTPQIQIETDINKLLAEDRRG